MATAEGVKNKIQNLIDTANKTTGARDTTLAEAFNSLMAGYEGSPFEINGTPRQFRVQSGASVSAGDFVELINSWGTGNISGTQSEALSAVALSDSRVVVLYSNASKQAQAVLVSIGESSVTIGTPLTFTNSKNTTRIAAVALDGQHILVAYNSDARSGRLTGELLVLQVTDNTLKLGSSYEFQEGNINCLSITRMSDTQGLISYTTGSDAYACPGFAQVADISGTNISLGTSTNYAAFAFRQKVVALSASKALVVICNPEHDSEVAGKAIVLTVSGTAVQKGTLYNFRNAFIGDVTAAAISNTKVLVAYYNKATSSSANAEVLTVSGTTVTAGAPVVLEAGVVSNTPTIAVMSGTKAILTWNAASYAKAAVATITGATITLGAAVTVHTLTASKVDTIALSDSTALTIYVTSSGTVYKGLNLTGDVITVAAGTGGTFVQPATSNATLAGVAKTTGAAGETVTVYRAY